MPFSERDWKHLRGLEATALQRYCSRVLDESDAIIHHTKESPHERYLRLFDLLRDRNADMAAAFDDLRRSTAIHHLAAMVRLRLLTDEELSGFQADVQETVRALADLLAPRRTATRRRR
jgi:hypothetical protein